MTSAVSYTPAAPMNTSDFSPCGDLSSRFAQTESEYLSDLKASGIGYLDRLAFQRSFCAIKNYAAKIIQSMQSSGHPMKEINRDLAHTLADIQSMIKSTLDASIPIQERKKALQTKMEERGIRIESCQLEAPAFTDADKPSALSKVLVRAGIKGFNVVSTPLKIIDDGIKSAGQAFCTASDSTASVCETVGKGAQFVADKVSGVVSAALPKNVKEGAEYEFSERLPKAYVEKYGLKPEEVEKYFSRVGLAAETAACVAVGAGVGKAVSGVKQACRGAIAGAGAETTAMLESIIKRQLISRTQASGVMMDGLTGAPVPLVFTVDLGGPVARITVNTLEKSPVLDYARIAPSYPFLPMTLKAPVDAMGEISFAKAVENMKKVVRVHAYRNTLRAEMAYHKASLPLNGLSKGMPKSLEELPSLCSFEKVKLAKPEIGRLSGEIPYVNFPDGKLLTLFDGFFERSGKAFMHRAVTPSNMRIGERIQQTLLMHVELAKKLGKKELQVGWNPTAHPVLTYLFETPSLEGMHLMPGVGKIASLDGKRVLSVVKFTLD